jgi:hypothetical protein
MHSISPGVDHSKLAALWDIIELCGDVCKI